MARRVLAALFTTASNTGCTSDGELAMTFRISAVAVCRSSAFLGLVEQPRVLDRDHRLVGEGLYQLELTVGEGTDLHPRQHKHADGSITAQQRHAQPRASRVGVSTYNETRFFQHVMNVDDIPRG